MCLPKTSKQCQVTLEIYSSQVWSLCELLSEQQCQKSTVFSLHSVIKNGQSQRYAVREVRFNPMAKFLPESKVTFQRSLISRSKSNFSFCDGPGKKFVPGHEIALSSGHENILGNGKALRILPKCGSQVNTQNIGQAQPGDPGHNILLSHLSYLASSSSDRDSGNLVI